MKSKTYGFVYITTNVINGKKYIGQRKYSSGWEYYLGSGVSFIKAIKKYGRKNFSREILAEAGSVNELNELEKFYIELYDATNNENFYNIAEGGNSGNKFAGKSKNEITEIGNKISSANKGRTLSEEHRLKLSQSKIGKYSGQESPMWGRHHSEITKEKMKNAKIGTKLSEETKNKMSELRKGEKHPNYGKFGANSSYSVSVILTNTGEVFYSITDAANKYNIHASNISMCCSGKTKSAGKHPGTGERLIWMYNN